MESSVLIDTSVYVRISNREEYYLSDYFTQSNIASFGHDKNVSSDTNHSIKYGVIICRYPSVGMSNGCKRC